MIKGRYVYRESLLNSASYSSKPYHPSQLLDRHDHFISRHYDDEINTTLFG